MSGNKELLPIYCRLRNSYCNVYRKKREMYAVTSVNYLIDNCKDGKVFWKTIGKLTKSNIIALKQMDKSNGKFILKMFLI